MRLWATIWLVLLTVGPAYAQQKRVVLNIELAEGQKKAIYAALAAELRPQSIVVADDEHRGARPSQLSPERPASEKDEDGQREAQDIASKEEKESAVRVLEEENAVAVLWLHIDSAASATWLRVMTKEDTAVRQTPLPYPPSAIDPRLFSIAAASLLEQVLQQDTSRVPRSSSDDKPSDARVQIQPVSTLTTAFPAGKTSAQLLAHAAASPAKEPPKGHTKDMHRFLLRVGLGFGLSRVAAGMRTASDPPMDTAPPFDAQGHFNPYTGWVPDADSRSLDSTSSRQSTADKNFTRECPADGTVTTASSGQLPSSYCARVKNTGLIFAPALRSELGYWILPRFALSAISRFQFAAGAGTLSHVLLGARAEYLLSSPQSDLNYSIFTGVTVGQIQPHAKPIISGDPSPYIRSGLGALHAGAALGWWFYRFAGLRFAPELDLFFPEKLIHIDITAGVETRF